MKLAFGLKKSFKIVKIGWMGTKPFIIKSDKLFLKYIQTNIGHFCKHPLNVERFISLCKHGTIQQNKYSIQ